MRWTLDNGQNAPLYYQLRILQSSSNITKQTISIGTHGDESGQHQSDQRGRESTNSKV